MDENKLRRVAPEVCSYVDDEHKSLSVEIVLAGVKKEAIQIKILDKSMTLEAPRGEIVYATTLSFCCPVRAEDAVANYEDGLLKIEAPFKDPMDDAVELVIN